MNLGRGENFTIDLEEGIAVCRVFRRTDLDREQVSAAAGALLGLARQLTSSEAVTGLIVDLRRVPGAASPALEGVYREIATSWEASGQRVSFLVLDDPLQKLQVARVVTHAAPRFGAVFTDRNDARQFVGMDATSDPSTLNRLLDRPSRVRGR